MAAVAAAVLLACILAAATLGSPPLLPVLILAAAGAVILLFAIQHPEWELGLHATAAALLGMVAGWTEDRIWWIAALSIATAIGTLWIAAVRARARASEAQAKSNQLATQVDRRISELFSLQELSYVLSQSIQLDRIADQVAKYAARFLQADGAIVVLAEGEQLRVVAATGTLEPLLGEVSGAADSLVGVAIARDRIEVAQDADTP
ncbi:MAG TPA: hypothetical protein VE420_09050, partial [Gemmatimonadales bacterium]|nr:hypothetical protein [Gemmatimonadales bacterium]